jgi:hypothetical protein
MTAKLRAGRHGRGAPFSMPLIPIYQNVWTYLQKPFVRGLAFNALDKHPFKYGWIDTNWRPA